MTDKQNLLPCPWCGKQPKMDTSIKNSEPVFSNLKQERTCNENKYL